MAKITVVGGINIDIEGRPTQKLTMQDSIPGHVSMAPGGVGRNIVENVGRLGADCAMLSLIGNDAMGLGAKSELESIGVDVSNVFVRPGLSTSIYLSVLDETGDMQVAINDMGIVDEITPHVIQECESFLKESEVVCLDGNLTRETLNYATELLKDKKLFYDPVSAVKGIKVKDFVGRFYAIKPNIMEAEALLDVKIESDEDLSKAGQKFLDLGVKKVFITLNKRGVFYKDNAKEGIIAPRKDLKIVSATGAGDAFSSCVLLGIANDYDIEEIAKMGMAASSIAMEASQAVNKLMSLEEVKRRK